MEKAHRRREIVNSWFYMMNARLKLDCALTDKKYQKEAIRVAIWTS